MDRKGREVVAAVASVAFRLKKAVAAVAHRGGSGRTPVVIVDVVMVVVGAVVVEVFIKTMRRTASMIQR